MEAKGGIMHTVTLLLTILLQSPQTIGPATDTYPVRQVSRENAQHLVFEIAKGKSADDFGHMMLLWIKITSDTVSDPELRQLEFIANRPASRYRGMSPVRIDEDLYKTLFAGQLLNIYENNREQERLLKEQKIAQEQEVSGLRKQIEEFRKQLDDLHDQLDKLASKKKVQ